MKDSINAVSGSTGITASMVEGDNSKIDLVQEEGYDIIIGDWTGQTTPTASGVTSFAFAKLDQKGTKRDKVIASILKYLEESS